MSQKTTVTLVFFVIFGLFSLFKSVYAPHSAISTAKVPLPSQRFLQSIHTAAAFGSCQAKGPLPDPSCTPGVANTDVTQENIQQTICVQGYTKTIRPPVSYTDQVKQERMAAYGDTDSRKDYELDHLIPLEVGGDPSSIENLWPEPALPMPGFHEKDVVENYLHEQVCSGHLKLKDAQQQITSNWTAVFTALPAGYQQLR